MVLSRETRVVVWGMDPKITLDEVPKLLRMDYNTSINYLTDKKHLSYNEKHLLNEWVSPKRNKTFTISQKKLAGEDVRFIQAVGKYETAASVNKAIIDNQVLPREYRVFNHTVDAVFFEVEGRVYCALEASSTQEGKVRSALFGQGRKEKKKEEWGKVDYQKIAAFSIDSKFFYWLFSKRGTTLKLPIGKGKTYEINLVDISAVSQLADKNAYDNKSEGADVLGSLPALSGLGTNQSVYEGGIHLTNNDVTLKMSIHYDCSCYIDSGRSTLTSQSQVNNIDNDFPGFVLVIYKLLFPGMFALHNQETRLGHWDQAKEEVQRKNWALKVIKELSDENGITYKDLRVVFGVNTGSGLLEKIRKQ